MKLEGSIAVVIGGACGMGKCYCDSLLQSGANVLICDVQEAAGKDTAAEFVDKFSDDRVYFRKCDGTSEDDIRSVLLDAKERWGRLDVVVNHVGILHETQWQKMVTINISSAIISTKVAEEILGKNNGGPGGVLVHTASRAGVIPSHLLPRYSATKAAMVQYARAMMHPLHASRHGLRIMCICPGITKTDFVVSGNMQERIGQTYPEVAKAMASKEESGTWVYPEWVGELLVDMLERDEEMAGVAAVLDGGPTPEFYYKGEWADVK